METPTRYQAGESPDKYVPRQMILRTQYFEAVKDIVCSLTLGCESYASDEELCDRAMAIADKLIEKVGEKL